MNTNENKKKKSLGLKILIGVLAVIAVLALCAVVFIGSKLGKLNFQELGGSAETGASTETADAEATVRPDEDEVMNILLVGVDNDYLPGMDDLGNADGIMLLSVNTKTKQVVLTSIMRDVYIEIPNQYSTKITLVYHDLGLEALIDTIEYNFDITIDNYAMVNYINIVNIVDALGGLELEIDASEISVMNDKMDNINYLVGDPEDSDMLSMSDVGMKLLNGKQVAAWLRIRMDGGNDQKRTERARRVILAAKDKVAEMGLLELNSFSDVVLENITTDITTTQALALLTKAPAYLKYDFVSSRIPLEGTYTGDGSYIYIDYDENVKALHESVYGESD